jgi:hypothetical protein
LEDWRHLGVAIDKERVSAAWTTSTDIAEPKAEGGRSPEGQEDHEPIAGRRRQPYERGEWHEDEEDKSAAMDAQPAGVLRVDFRLALHHAAFYVGPVVKPLRSG